MRIMGKCYIETTRTGFENWSKKTEMNDLPADDGWTHYPGFNGSPSVKGGFLKVVADTDIVKWYKSWSASNSVGVTSEIRMKLNYPFTNDYNLEVEDGTKRVLLRIEEDRVRTSIPPIIDVVVDTSEYHTYRLLMKETEVKLFVDGELKGTTTPTTTTNNKIAFGPDGDAVGTSFVDYVYYSTDGVFESQFFTPLKASLEKQTSSAVDTLSFTVKKDDDVEVDDDVDFYISEYKSDATWEDDVHKFTGIVRKTKTGTFKEVNADSYGSVLNDVYVDKYYDAETDIAWIASDLIFCYGSDYGLTFDRTDTSGFTLSKFLARGLLIDVIRSLADVLGWVFRTDEDKSFFFEAPTDTVYGDNAYEVISFDVGGLITDYIGSVASAVWNKDYSEVFNRIILIGDTTPYGEEETVSGSRGWGSMGWTTTDLNWKPNSFKLMVSDMTWHTDTYWLSDSSGWHAEPLFDSDGGEIYSVDRNGKEIVFTQAPLYGTDNIRFEYDFFSSVVVDTGSVEDERCIIVNDKSIRNFDDAEDFAFKFLEAHQSPRVTGKIKVNRYYYNLTDGLSIFVSDSQHDVALERKCVKKIVWNYPSGIVEMELGYPESLLYDWQARTSQRIRDLQDRLVSMDVVRTFLSEAELLGVSETSFMTDAYTGAESIISTFYTDTLVRDIVTYPYKVGTGYHTYVNFFDITD